MVYPRSLILGPINTRTGQKRLPKVVWPATRPDEDASGTLPLASVHVPPVGGHDSPSRVGHGGVLDATTLKITIRLFEGFTTLIGEGAVGDPIMGPPAIGAVALVIPAPVDLKRALDPLEERHRELKLAEDPKNRVLLLGRRLYPVTVGRAKAIKPRPAEPGLVGFPTCPGEADQEEARGGGPELDSPEAEVDHLAHLEYGPIGTAGQYLLAVKVEFHPLCHIIHPQVIVFGLWQA